MLLAGTAATANAARAAEGRPDPQFATGGTFSHQFGFGSFQPLSMAFAGAEQSNGDLVLAGESGDGGGLFDLLVVRLTPSGGLDPTFGSGGVVDLNLGPQHATAGVAVAIQNDGRIVVGANTYNGYEEATIVRLRPTGALDSAFGTGGVTSLPNLTTDGLALAPNGNVVIAGTWHGTSPSALALAELTPSGSPATTFGSGGMTIDQLSPASGSAGQGIAVDPAGRIDVTGVSYATGLSTGSGELLRFGPSGALDSSFGSGGSVALASDGEALALEGDGSALTAGLHQDSTGARSLVVQRFLTGGQPDPRFGLGGEAALAGTVGGGSDERADSVAVEPNGEILAASSANPYGRGPTSVWLLKPNGTPDAGFGSSGVLSVAGDRTAVSSQRDGKPVIAGGVPSGQQIVFTVMRLLGSRPAANGGGHPAPPRLRAARVSCRSRRLTHGPGRRVLCRITFSVRSRALVSLELRASRHAVRTVTRRVAAGRHSLSAAVTLRRRAHRPIRIRVLVRVGPASRIALTRTITLR